MKISECVRQICKATGSLVEATEKLLALSIAGTEETELAEAIKKALEEQAGK
jgi:hypothetical protein